MTPSTGGDQPPLRNVDLSAEVPAPKSFHAPIRQTRADELEVRVTYQALKVRGKAKVNGGVRRSVEFAVVCATATAAASATVALCYLSAADGWTTLVVAATAGLVTLGLGLLYTSFQTSGS
jgi:hypothetical protein